MATSGQIDAMVPLPAPPIFILFVLNHMHEWMGRWMDEQTVGWTD